MISTWSKTRCWFRFGHGGRLDPRRVAKVYWNLFVGGAIYTLGSEAINAAIARGNYSSGSIYDLPLLVAIGWMTWTAFSARKVDLTVSASPEPPRRWTNIAPRLAMIAILSLPLLGLWALFAPNTPSDLRNFRLLATMAATTVLGGFVFLKQILLDRQLIRLLDESRQSYENLQRLQNHLVQKEKLASLGQLVAGAAHEINNPLAAILGYSELLATQASLQGEQATMAQKIGQQARRTRDLVADLLSFSQQSPSEKILMDVGGLVQRALQMNDVQIRGKNIRVEAILEPVLPRIWGNSNQLLQTFLHLTENAIDALNEVGGGALLVTGRQVDQEVVIEFSDSGPGMVDAERVFDPFYTTKPVGKGTGLGLSASYGVVQDHHGHISAAINPTAARSSLCASPRPPRPLQPSKPAAETQRPPLIHLQSLRFWISALLNSGISGGVCPSRTWLRDLMLLPATQVNRAGPHLL
jgi:signal transduction histidine kinase